MAKLASLTDLKGYIRRALGSPVINVEIDDTQLDDRIEDAIDLYNEYHYDAVDIGYYVMDLIVGQNEYVLPDYIQEVVNILPTSLMSMADEFDEDQGMLMKPFYVGNGSDGIQGSMDGLVDYEIYMQTFRNVQKYFEKNLIFDFNGTSKKLSIAETPTEAKTIVLRVYKSDINIVNVINNSWMKRYCVALAKIQWGTNVSKFDGVTLPSGATINGKDILAEGKEERDTLREELEDNYSEPPDPFIG